MIGTPLSRRDLGRLVGLLLVGGAGVGALSDAGAAQEDGDLTVAELEVDSNPDGFRVTLADIVADVMPADTTYTVRANGTDIGSFVGNDGVSVGGNLTGTITVAAQSGKSLLERLRALLWSNNTLRYDTRLGSPAPAFEEGTEVELSAHPIWVEAQRNAGADGSVATLGSVSIPHQFEAGNESAGTYGITRIDGQDILTYTVGPNPPDASELVIKMRVSDVDELVDDIERRLP